MSWSTYCSPGSRPPLVIGRRDVPPAVARVAARVLRVSVGLVVDVVVDGGGAGAGAALLLRGRLLVRVAEGRVDGQVVVGAVHLPGDSAHAAAHRALGGVRMEGRLSGTSTRQDWQICRNQYENRNVIGILFVAGKSDDKKVESVPK